MGEGGASQRVGLGGGQRLAVLGHQADRRAAERLGRLQRADHDVERIRAGVGGQRHVGEDHPAAGLRRRRAFVGLVGEVAAAGGVARLDHIAARLHLLQHRAQREHGRGVLAGIAFHVDEALPDDLALVVRAVVAVVVGILALGRRVGRADRLAHQVAVDHPPDLDAQLGDADGLDADAVAILARQDHAVAGEADVGRLVAVGEVGVGVGGQRLAVLRRQALQQGDVAVGEADAADAQLVLAGDRHRRRVAEVGRDQHEIAVGFVRVQVAGHADAGERVGLGGVEPGLPDREAVRLHLAGARRVGVARMAEHRPDRSALFARRMVEQGPVDALGQQEAPAEGYDHRANHGRPTAVHRNAPCPEPWAKQWKRNAVIWSIGAKRYLRHPGRSEAESRGRTTDAKLNIVSEPARPAPDRPCGPSGVTEVARFRIGARVNAF